MAMVDSEPSEDFSTADSAATGTGTFVSALDEEEYYPKSLQEELNEIIEAWYELISEEDIQQFQLFLEDIQGQKIAEGAIQNVGEEAPDFELPDQDGEVVSLDDLCQKGPVVLLFYRGKWCPHCSTTIRRMQQILPQIEAKGASLVAISPMLPDGTQFMATKMSLGFPVCSDVGNLVAKRYKLTFAVHPDVRDSFVKWGEDIPKFNGDFTWEIPLPATYILNQQRQIVWSFLDNDPGVRGEPEDILAAIPTLPKQKNNSISTEATACSMDDGSTSTTDTSASKRRKNNRGLGNAFKAHKLRGSMRGSIKKLFGGKKESRTHGISHVQILDSHH
jgi:peroxiredoxin